MPTRMLTTLVALFYFVTPLHADSRAEDLLKKSDAWFRSEDGTKALSAILSWQSQHGDWPKNSDTSSKQRTGDRSKVRGTFDNGATTGELRVLARAIRITDQQSYKKSFLKGFDHILNAQYANGGWPQYFPLRKGYYTRITFNDNCMIRILQFLRDSTTEKDFSFLDKQRIAAARKAIERGTDCILKCQVVIDGQPTVWCAQHDEVTFAPAKARSYELASLSGSESAVVLKYLMAIENPSPDVIRAIDGGVAWFRAVAIEGFRYDKTDNGRRLTKDPNGRTLWARFYELKTNRPFFCDRDGIPKYNLNEIGDERRNGYSWYGSWGDSLLNSYAKWPHRKNVAARNE